jgi:hypothetical protein
MAKAKDELQELQEIGALRFPEQYRGTRGPSTEQLGTTAKQAGLLGLGFAPGAGMADYFGQFPAMEGGTEPSAVENWRQGNYGTSALQGLGAMGDLMYAVPVLGATVGSALKGPRAAQRMLKELPTGPKISEEGFYSQVEKAILDNPQQKGTGDQFLAQIQKTPGVKPEEIQYTGLDAFLAGRPSVTKAEIQDYLDTNRVQLKEVTIGGRTREQQLRDVLEDAGYMEVNNAFDELDGLEPILYNTRTHRDVRPEDLPVDVRNSLQEIMTMPDSAFTATPPRFGDKVLPGGENYREVLLTMPSEARGATDVEIRALNDRLIAKGFDGLGTEELDALRSGSNDAIAMLEDYDARLGVRTADLIEVMQGGMSSNTFRTIHFDQPNILAHMRLNDRTVDGKPTLFVEEIQSDWHQTGRKKGYGEQPTYAEGMEGNPEGFLGMKQGVPDAPFKTSWHELTLKKALNEASTKGYDQIAFTTGKTQADRYDLSKQVDRISYFKKPNGQYHVVAKDKKTGRDVELGTNNSLDDLEGKIGKSLTEKISRGEGNFSGGDFTDLTGVDLQVGGEGMKGFYDTILPKSLDKIGKKYGTTVRKTTMDTPDGPVEVWAMDIPPEMRETISSQGQPLFQIGAGAAGLGTAGILSLTPGEAEAASEDNNSR